MSLACSLRQSELLMPRTRSFKPSSSGMSPIQAPFSWRSESRVMSLSFIHTSSERLGRYGWRGEQRAADENVVCVAYDVIVSADVLSLTRHQPTEIDFGVRKWRSRRVRQRDTNGKLLIG